MSTLQQPVGRATPVTPEAIAEWMIPRHRAFFCDLFRALQAPRPDIPAVAPAPAALAELSAAAHGAQLAVVAFTYRRHLDDTRFIAGPANNRPSLVRFLERLQERAGPLVEPAFKIDSGVYDPVPLQPFGVVTKNVLPRFLLYYGALCAPVEKFRDVQPAAFRFTQTMVQRIKANAAMAQLIAVTYYFAHKALSNAVTHGFEDAPLTLRTWPRWTEFLLNYPAELMRFHDNRAVAFE